MRKTYNELVEVLIRDLHLFERPTYVSTEAYLNQLLYSGTSEWIRAITLDVDPMLGSNKIGVTVEYLRDRAAAVLMDLSQLITGKVISIDTARANVSWMIESMRSIGELWEPYPGHILCAQNAVVGYIDGYPRISGLRPVDDDLALVGVCHYGQTQHEREEAKSFEKRRIESEKALAAIQPDMAATIGHSAEECIDELKKKYRVFVKGNFMTVYEVKKDAPEYLRNFILTSGWPVLETASKWEDADKWMLRIA